MQVEITANIGRRLKTELRRAGRREIGGILMGEQLSPGHFRIIDFSVDSVTGSAAHFVRSEEAHIDALNDFFARTGREYARYNYLGEWHSHPTFPVYPSMTDVGSMTGLVDGERNIYFAVLLIVRLDMWVHLRHSLSLFVRGKEPSIIHAK